ncbi:putative Carboxylesterase [Xenorhabdus poinarii G6]|uniref:Putative Carboxylesterase n=1 Tax=Xenorhabdus poinarii G6 TaxID=1354304 RepID=A0A068QZA6_9GAMM|nr:dienelactone hydrolase family protein [Xenorhabdus poinarii]CDG20367.1 putative Carboxylesterase [Xenorhabdus poinarii G6]
MLKIKAISDTSMYSVVKKGAELSTENPVVILLHGRRQTVDDMSNLIQKLNLDDVTYLLPCAPDTTWYPHGFTRDIEENQPFLNNGLDYINDVLQDLLSQGVSSQNIWLIGFSQGACMAAEFLRQSLYQVGGAIMFTGGLFGPNCPKAASQKNVFNEMKVFLTGSNNDTWVSAERVTQTAEYFDQLGAKVHLQIFTERDHYISKSEIETARELISSSFAMNHGEVAYA